MRTRASVFAATLFGATALTASLVAQQAAKTEERAKTEGSAKTEVPMVR